MNTLYTLLQYGGQYLLYGAWLGMFQNRDGSLWNWVHSGEEVVEFNWALGEPTSAQYRWVVGGESTSAQYRWVVGGAYLRTVQVGGRKSLPLHSTGGW